MIFRSYTQFYNRLAGELNICLSKKNHWNIDDYEKLLAEGYKNIKTLKSLIKTYKKAHAKKLDSLPYLVSFFKEHEIKRVFSAGSGPSVLEYELAKLSDVEIMTSDFCSFDWEKYYKNEQEKLFKFTQVDLRQIKDELKGYDCVFSFGAFYTLNDKEFRHFLEIAKASGIKYIIDFHAGHIKGMQIIRAIMKAIFPFLQPKVAQLHGYARTTSHLKRLYKKSGWKILGRIPTQAYSFSPILELI